MTCQGGEKFATSLAHTKRHHSFTGSNPCFFSSHNYPPFSNTNTLHKCEHHTQIYTKYFLESCYYVYTSLKLYFWHRKQAETQYHQGKFIYSEKIVRCNVSKQMRHTKECTTHQTAAFKAQIKDFPVLCSTLIHRTGPYVITITDKMPFSINDKWHLGGV